MFQFMQGNMLNFWSYSRAQKIKYSCTYVRRSVMCLFFIKSFNFLDCCNYLEMLQSNKIPFDVSVLIYSPIIDFNVIKVP